MSRMKLQSESKRRITARSKAKSYVATLRNTRILLNDESVGSVEKWDYKIDTPLHANKKGKVSVYKKK